MRIQLIHNTAMKDTNPELHWDTTNKELIKIPLKGNKEIITPDNEGYYLIPYRFGEQKLHTSQLDKAMKIVDKEMKAIKKFSLEEAWGNGTHHMINLAKLKIFTETCESVEYNGHYLNFTVFAESKKEKYDEYLKDIEYRREVLASGDSVQTISYIEKVNPENAKKERGVGRCGGRWTVDRLKEIFPKIGPKSELKITKCLKVRINKANHQNHDPILGLVKSEYEIVYTGRKKEEVIGIIDKEGKISFNVYLSDTKKSERYRLLFVAYMRKKVNGILSIERDKEIEESLLDNDFQPSVI